MADWDKATVDARLVEAVRTARRLPPARVRGHFNAWPEIIREEWETYGVDEPDRRPMPPSPEAIDRMLETTRWMQWLEVEQRHLVWMRAKRYGWRDISIRFACNRSTAWRHWQRALQQLADHLNQRLVTR
ncbi:MAG: helix-turn-helix domain-containing protein [Betaproteobacteria bacterium]|nr:helix-turn-helix domain-containing protein [Betaproteobacteria bacterium]